MPWYEPHPTPADLSATLACSWTATPSGRHRLVPDACVELLWLTTGPVIGCGPETRAWTFERHYAALLGVFEGVRAAKRRAR